MLACSGVLQLDGTHLNLTSQRQSHLRLCRVPVLDSFIWRCPDLLQTLVAWARNGCHRYPGLAGRFRGNMQCFVGLPARLEWWRCRKRRNVFLDLCLSQRVRRFAMVYFTTQCFSILASHPNNISLAFCILAPQKAGDKCEGSKMTALSTCSTTSSSMRRRHCATSSESQA